MTSPTSGRPLPSSFDDNEEFYNENGFQKVLTRMKREPLVPLGCLITVGAFVNAYRAMRKGDHQQVQRMFRARVAAQGFTIVAIVAGGLYFGAERQKEREVWKAAQEDKANEKREKWIRELEARDEEEQALKARLERRKEKKRAADAEAAKAAFRTSVDDTKTDGAAAPADAAASSKSGSSWTAMFGGSGGPKKEEEDHPSPQPILQDEASRK